MQTDNECTRAGWTEAFISDGMYDLHISHAPDADLDGTFRAFCHDEQEMLTVHGWMLTAYEPIPE